MCEALTERIVFGFPAEKFSAKNAVDCEAKRVKEM